MTRFIRRRACVLAALVLGSALIGRAQHSTAKHTAVHNGVRVAGTPSYTALSINNINMWIRADGLSNSSPSGDYGIRYPRWSGDFMNSSFGPPAVYMDGLVWGGKAYRDSALTRPAPGQLIRIGGGEFVVGTQAGRVIGFGSVAQAENPQASDVRVVRIRRDYTEQDGTDWGSSAIRWDSMIINEIFLNSVTGTMFFSVFQQYEKDWKEWPVNKGAPFIDRNANGVFDPPPPFGMAFTAESLITGNFDEPGVAGADLSKPADQVIWTVSNDLDTTLVRSFANSEPLGLEIQRTIWGYKSRTERLLENVYFVRYRIINKGGVDTSEALGTQPGSLWIDSLYIGQWSDSDVGAPGNDVAGFDTLLSLGFTYNGEKTDDQFTHGFAPTAVGYDILAGPALLSPGESGIVGFRRQQNVRNTPASAFISWGPSDPLQSPEGAYETNAGMWWKALRGFLMYGDINSPDVRHPNGPFMFTGDPTTLTGWVDGLGTPNSWFPGDKNTLASVGPLQLAPGDTVELYVGVVIGQGADRMSSLAVMKANDRQMQSFFDRELQPAAPPSSPVVTTSALDREIILEWGLDHAAIERTETSIKGGVYAFEGYTVYQLPSVTAHLSEATRVATFDKPNGIRYVKGDVYDYTSGFYVSTLLQTGSDGGIRRSLRIDRDMIAQIQTGEPTPLYNGKEYYFAVTAYNVNTVIGQVPASMESTPVVVRVKPRIPFGQQVTTKYGDTLAVDHVAGLGKGSVAPIVVDPLLGTGDSYRLTFQPSAVDSLTLTIENFTRNAIIVSGLKMKDLQEVSMGVPGGIHIGLSVGTFSEADTFEYNIPAPSANRALENESVKRIGVFPNPYKAEISGWTMYGGRQRQYVTFNNLPQRAVIRIFNLAGHLVRMFRKDDASQFFEWDLLNEDGWLVASGIYICHIDLPDLGSQKVLKLAIISAQ